MGFILISLVAFVFFKPSQVLAGYHLSDSSIDGQSLASESILKILEDPWNGIMEADCFSEQYANFYNTLAYATAINISINPIVDALLAKVRKDIIDHAINEFLVPQLKVRIPDGAFELAGVFHSLYVSGGETVERDGNAMASLWANGEITMHLPIKVVNGTAHGKLRIEIMGIKIDAGVTGDLTKSAIYHMGVTIYPRLVPPKITKLKMIEPGHVTVVLPTWRPAVAYVLVFVILFILFLIMLICLIVFSCCWFFKMRRVSKELKELRDE